MRNRRFAQLHTSDDDDDAPPPPRNSTADLRKRKKVHLPSDDEDEEMKIEAGRRREQRKKKKTEVPEPDPESENEEQDDVEAFPLGEPIRHSGKGRGRRSHFESFEYDGNQYQLVSFFVLFFSIAIYYFCVFCT